MTHPTAALTLSLCLIGGTASAQTAPPVDPQQDALKAQHAASLMAHLPFNPEVVRLSTPNDPAARVPELRDVQTTPVRDLYSDTWVAMDDAGRSLPTAGTARTPQAGKTVGLFYYVNMPHDRGPVQDMTKILQESPGNPQWGKPRTTYWWGEPDIGYRRSNDFWVLRRDLSMFADAGVDVLMFDTTNAHTYWETYFNLCRVARWMHSMGQKTPQIAFVTNHRMSERITSAYDEMYSKNLYPEMWFRWEGKPIIFGKKDALDPDDQSPLPQEIQDFFTWRYSWAWNPAKGNWPWLERHPQKGGLHPETGALEEVSASAASHPTILIGKSFHDKKQPPLDAAELTPQSGTGPHFAEQLGRRAIELDPPFLWLTQWNEWAAVSPLAGPKGARLVGRPVKQGEQYLVDGYNAEFNRDIAPMKGGYGDNYYYQMVDGIRRFKGVRPTPTVSGFQNVDITRLADWTAVTPEYRDSQGDTLHRDWPGHGGNYYTNNSGRNDIVTAKVAADAEQIAFWVQTAAPLSPASDPLWMQLLINTDRDYQTGWKGFDFAVADYDPATREATLKTLRPDGSQTAVATRVRFHASGDQLAIAIPRTALNLAAAKGTTFDFHWADNASIGGDIRDWWLQGDSAPNGRFNYRYEQLPKE